MFYLTQCFSNIIILTCVQNKHFNEVIDVPFSESLEPVCISHLPNTSVCTGHILSGLPRDLESAYCQSPEFLLRLSIVISWHLCNLAE